MMDGPADPIPIRADCARDWLSLDGPAPPEPRRFTVGERVFSTVLGCDGTIVRVDREGVWFFPDSCGDGGPTRAADLGGSASMTAAALYWPETGRLEAHGWFPSKPSLGDRGAADGVGGRYNEMADRGELSTLGEQTVPVAPWLSEVMRRIEGQPVSALVMDRYKQAELGEAIDRAGIRAPLVWRGMGFRDGNEDAERFRRAVFDGKVKAAPSLLLRSAFADTVCLRDPANNIKIAKARSLGRIDAASAAVLAVAEGVRQTARATPKGGRLVFG